MIPSLTPANFIVVAIITLLFSTAIHRNMQRPAPGHQTVVVYALDANGNLVRQR
jgi:hypothetical protein